jgi:hypothetical protein
MTNHEAFVVFDVHKETIAVAIAEGGAGGLLLYIFCSQ